MPTAKPAAQTIDLDAIAGTVRDLAERIRTLTIEGKPESATALQIEAETVISNSLKGTKAAVVELRKTLRNELTEAGKASAPGSEVAKTAAAEAAEVERPVWMDELVAKGADQVKMIAATNVRGGRALAELFMDSRRRILNADGLPDLKATSIQARAVASEVYGKVFDELAEEGTNDTDDAVRAVVKRIQRDAQNTVIDVRVEYIRSLDDEHNADRALFAGKITPTEGQSFSDAVAKHYVITLKTRAELAVESRAAKALADQAAKELTSGGDSAEDSEVGSAGDAGMAPAARLRKLIENVAANVSTIETIETDALSADLSAAPADYRESIAESVRAQIAALTEILARVEG